MIKLYLPIDLKLFENLNISNIPIDMSDLRFPCIDENKVRHAYIFLRNINMNLKLDFDNCLYNRKEEFILMYLNGNINLNLPIMINTWIDILTSQYMDIPVSGILSKEEIELFISRNNDFISEVNKLIASLVVLSVYQYSKSNASGANMIEFDNEFEESDYNKINFHNLSFLTSHEYFGFLFQNSKYKPRFYSKYFMGTDQIAITRINNNLPILSLLSIYFSPQSIQDDFIDKIDKFTTSSEEELKDE